MHRGVFLYGASGNGKSSLVNAGLLPQTRRLGVEPVRVRVQPRAEQELVVEQYAIADDGAERLPWLAPDNDGSSRIVLSITEFERRVRTASPEHRPLIIFDQFEEIVTLFNTPTEDATRRQLVELIVRLLREPLPLKILFAFREDYLGAVKQLLHERDELVDQAQRLGPVPADALATIIGGPFERFPPPGGFAHELDGPLATRLQQALTERFSTGQVSLSEVQTVCLRLWRSEDPDAELTRKGVQGLLEDELGEALAAFPDPVRNAAVALLSEMVTTAGTRNVISAEDLRLRVHDQDPDVPPELLDDALQRLERDSKLVRRERRRDLYLYEITSEFLVPWITKRREELAVQRARQRERRRFRIVAMIAAALLLIVAIVAVLAIWALQQRNEARRRTAEATSVALATSARAPLRTRPDIALSLAFAAYSERPRPEAHAVLVDALAAARSSGLQRVFKKSEQLSFALSPDGSTIATDGVNGEVILSNPATGRRIARLTGPKGFIHGIAISSDGRLLAAGADDGFVGLWNPATHARLALIEVDAGGVSDVALSLDGTTVAASDTGGTVHLFSTATHRRVARLQSSVYGGADTVAFSPDGNTVAAAGDDGAIRLWSRATHRRIATLAGHARAGFVLAHVNDIAFGPDGAVLASAGDDDTVRLWSLASHRQLARFSVGDSQECVAFSPDGGFVASAGADRMVHLWSSTSHRQLTRIATTDRVVGLAFGPDAKTLVSAEIDGTVRVADPTAYQRMGRLVGNTDDISGLEYSPTGKILASKAYERAVRLWNPVTRRPIAPLPVGSPVTAATFSPDGRTFATGDNNGTIGLWDIAARRQVAHLQTDADLDVEDVDFSPDGKTLASIDSDRSIDLWDLSHKPLRRRLAGAGPGVLVVRFSPDGKTVAAAGTDGNIRLWDPATRKQRAVLRDRRAVYAIEFSPDGSMLASAGSDGTIGLWNPSAGTRIGSLVGAQGQVDSLAFSPDGKTLASGGRNSEVSLWDPSARRAIGRLRGHTGGYLHVAFSPDGRTLASGGDDKTILLTTDVFWRDEAELRKTVCDILVTEPTAADWARYAPGIPSRRACA